MDVKLVALAVGAAAILVIAGHASAQSPATAGMVVEEQQGGSRFGGDVIADTNLGFGTFVAGTYDDDPLLVENLSLRPRYRIDEIPGKAQFILRQDVSWEFTDPANPEGRRYEFADTMLWLVAPNLYREKVTGIAFGGEARLTVPISLVSQQQRKFTAATLGFRASKAVGDWTFQLRLLGTKHFYRYSNQVLTAEDAQESDDYALAGCREGEEFCAGGAYLVNWSFSTYTSATWSFTEKLGASLVLQYGAGWRHSSPNDQYTSKATTVDGDRVVQTGAARMADTVVSAIDLSYQYDDTWAFSTGISTAQPVLGSDNKSFRNPLFDADTPRNNYSGLYFDVVASF